MDYIKPKCLKAGDTIAVLSPSSGLPSIFPHIYEHGLKNLRETFGFNILEMPTAMMDDEALYRNPKQRATDINEAFANPDVSGILFGRARDYSIQEKHDLVAMIRTMLAVEFNQPDLPVVANLDFGHTDPQWILPNGILTEINCGAKTIRLLECPTS